MAKRLSFFIVGLAVLICAPPATPQIATSHSSSKIFL